MKKKKAEDKTVYTTSTNVGDWSDMPIIQDMYCWCPQCKAKRHGRVTTYKDESSFTCNHCKKRSVAGTDPQVNFIVEDFGSQFDPRLHRPGRDDETYDTRNDQFGKHLKG